MGRDADGVCDKEERSNYLSFLTFRFQVDLVYLLISNIWIKLDQHLQKI